MSDREINENKIVEMNLFGLQLASVIFLWFNNVLDDVEKLFGMPPVVQNQYNHTSATPNIRAWLIFFVLRNCFDKL